MDDKELAEDDLSKEEWAEIYRREKMLESGEVGSISLADFGLKLKAFDHE